MGLNFISCLRILWQVTVYSVILNQLKKPIFFISRLYGNKPKTRGKLLNTLNASVTIYMADKNKTKYGNMHLFLYEQKKHFYEIVDRWNKDDRKRSSKKFNLNFFTRLRFPSPFIFFLFEDCDRLLDFHSLPYWISIKIKVEDVV